MAQSFLVNIDGLSPQQRLRLIEELWGSLRQADAAVPLIDTQRRERDRRLDDFKRKGPVGIPSEEVLRQIPRAPRLSLG